MDKIFSSLIKNFKNSYTIIESEVLTLIEQISEIDANIFLHEPLKSFYSKDSMNNVKLVVFVLIVGIIIYKCGKVILYMYKENSFNLILKTVIKAILAIILATNSFYILKEIINVNYLFTEAVESLFSEIVNDEISFKSLDKSFNSVEEFFRDKFKINIKDTTKIVSCILLITLLIIFSIRYVIVLLFLILFPFILLFFIFDSTNYIIRKVFIIFFFNLTIQNLNKVILFIPIISKKEKIYEVILIGTLFVLYKINKSIISIGDIWKR